MKSHLKELLQRRPELAVCAGDIQTVNAILSACFRRGGRVYLCGNGGSAADCEHWAGELLPATQTHLIQEQHLAIYHTLCLALEAEFFPERKRR